MLTKAASFFATALLFAASSHAQMYPDTALTPDKGACDLAVALPTAAWSRDCGMEQYEKGDYAAALEHLRRAAELGDARAAETVSLMYRFGESLYGDRVRADEREAARFTALAVRLRQGRAQ